MGLLENMKEVADLIKKVGDIELYRKVVESEGEVIELTREKRQLEDRVRELEALAALQKEMKFSVPFYFQDGDETPFCPTCWERNRAAVHLFLVFKNAGGTRWDCYSCKSSYMTDRQGARQPQPGGSPHGPEGWMAR